MNYQYFYQTKNNENRSGTIKAPSRAEVYTLLRLRGIRPFRVIGEDPPRWRPWVAGAAVALLVIAAIGSLIYTALRDPETLTVRGMREQLVGDSSFIAHGVMNGWDGVFSNRLDGALALYAQPGWNVVVPADIEKEITTLTEKDLLGPVTLMVDTRPELEQLREIVKTMRRELLEYIYEGGNLADYFQLLDERQARERALGEKARTTYLHASPEQRGRVRRDLNVRLKGMGLAPLPSDL